MGIPVIGEDALPDSTLDKINKAIHEHARYKVKKVKDKLAETVLMDLFLIAFATQVTVPMIAAPILAIIVVDP